MFTNIFRSLKTSFSSSAMAQVVHNVDTPFKKATFGMGCFWACDSLFGSTNGVLRTKVGYSGGTMVNPVYRNLGDHTEVIEIHYDPNIVKFEDLLKLFWNNHEYGLTTKIKRQYMSLILYHDDEQKKISEDSMKREAEERKEHLITEVRLAKEFYSAEDYHQKYRLQGHKWLCEQIGINAELLQTSTTAARFNGYVAGVGTVEALETDAKLYQWPAGVVDYVKEHLNKNLGGNLYC